MKKYISVLESIANFICGVYLALCIFLLIILILPVIEEFTGNIGVINSVHNLIK